MSRRARAKRHAKETAGDFVARVAAQESPEIRLLKEEIRRLKASDERLQGARTLIRCAVADAFAEPLALALPATPKDTGAGRELVAVLHVSDVQYGKTTADYDSTVAGARLRELARKTVLITNTHRAAHKVDECRLYLGGDIVEGELIFPGQAHQIDQSVFDQAVRGAPAALAGVTLYLLEHFKRVRIVTVPGNHGRPADRGAQSSPRTNWDNVVYDVLKVLLLGSEAAPRPDLADRLEVAISESWYAVDRVAGWGNLVVHGDQVRGGFAGFPWYGVGRRAWGWIDAIPEPWTYLWLGHFHTYASAVLNQRMMLANGTVESSNTYAQANLAASGTPCQRLAFFDREHGLVADHQIWLDKRERR